MMQKVDLASSSHSCPQCCPIQENEMRSKHFISTMMFCVLTKGRFLDHADKSVSPSLIPLTMSDHVEERIGLIATNEK